MNPGNKVAAVPVAAAAAAAVAAAAGTSGTNEASGSAPVQPLSDQENDNIEWDLWATERDNSDGKSCFGAPCVPKEEWAILRRTVGDRPLMRSLAQFIAQRQFTVLPHREHDNEHVRRQFVRLYGDNLRRFWIGESFSPSSSSSGQVPVPTTLPAPAPTHITQEVIRDEEIGENQQQQEEEQQQSSSMFIEFKQANNYSVPVGPVLGVTQLGHSYNIISDCFQRTNRMQCGGHSHPSPHAVWTGIGLDNDNNHVDLLQKMLSGILRLSNDGKGLHVGDYLACLRIANTCYQAVQFKVHVAAQIYKSTGARRVIDFSCGWGDRLAAFYATPGTLQYVGCDPNAETFAAYRQQVLTYDRWRFEIESGDNQEAAEYEQPTIVNTASTSWFFFSPSTNVTVQLFNQPAEDVAWNQLPGSASNGSASNGFDLVFTSPPYFCTERYAAHLDECKENQSWYRYRTADQWTERFLLPVLANTTALLRPGGWLMLNILDPELPAKLGGYQPIVDPMREFMDQRMAYRGAIGMRLKQRPKKRKRSQEDPHGHAYMQAIVCEAIWCWQK